MYLRFFGLRQEPFSIAPDPRFLFLSDRHREALAHLRYGLGGSGGFVVLTGEIGAGKTTVCRCLLEQIPKQCNVAYVFNPKLTVRELLQTVCADFGILSPREDVRTASLKDYIDALNAYLLRTHAAGEHNVLIVDEAQRLPPDLLEQLRLLTNLETNERKLLQIVLIGQPELREMLARPDLEQLAQRVVARFHLGTLTEAETEQYIRHRLGVAGLERAIPFDADALKRIHKLARGVPRRINLLCDRALLGGYAEGRRRIGKDVIDKAAREVFGDPAGHDRPDRARLGWAIGGVALAAAAAGLAWYAWQARDGGAAPTVAASASAAAARASGPATGGLVAVGPGAPAASDAAGTSAPAAASGPAAAASAPVAMAQEAELAAWLVEHAPADESAAWQALASAWQARPVAGDACDGLRAQGLQCHKRRGTLGLLQTLDRPALLPLYLGKDARPRFVTLAASDGSSVLLRAGGRELRVGNATWAALWRDEFGTLLRLPEGARLGADGVLERVDRRWLAERLARARGASAPAPTLATGESQREAIRAFQRAAGLESDGQLGALTVMQLERAAGGGEPRLGR